MKPKEENQVRLQKLLAEAGLCSRREAEALIRAGRGKVNGKTAELGQQANRCKDYISVDERSINVQRPRHFTLVMNKPKGLICSHADPYHERTVFDLLPPPYQKERLFCIGRLDKESQGLLLLTNDGDLANRVSPPSNQVVKRYQVTLNRPFDTQNIPFLLKGILVEDERLRADKVFPVSTGIDRERKLEIHLHQGRKREIRRMLEALGYYVKKLFRFQVGQLKLRGLGPGRFRELSAKEIKLLLH